MSEQSTTRESFLQARANLPEKAQIARALIDGILPAADDPDALDVSHAIAELTRAIIRVDMVLSNVVDYKLE